MVAEVGKDQDVIIVYQKEVFPLGVGKGPRIGAFNKYMYPGQGAVAVGYGT